MNHTTKRARAWRLGQGMTESVVVVGLIAIVLLTVMERYRSQLEVTYLGTTNTLDRHVGQRMR